MMKRKWIPIIGWILVYGFFHNCVIVPYFGFPVVDWEYLIGTLAIMLGVGGARDVLKKGKTKNESSDKTI